MKFLIILYSVLALARSAAAHYIFGNLITSSKTYTNSLAIRQPPNNSPVEKFMSNEIRCNVGPSSASQTVTVPSGSTVGFQILWNAVVFHKGPLSIYLGKAPAKAKDWDGSGQRWFKIAEWGASFNPFNFTSLGMSQFTTTIPSNTPPGEYLLRIEHAALHLTGAPEFFISCAQIAITGLGKGKPAMVSIPGYVSNTTPGLMVNIYWPVPTSYTPPGPTVWRG